MLPSATPHRNKNPPQVLDWRSAAWWSGRSSSQTEVHRLMGPVLLLFMAILPGFPAADLQPNSLTAEEVDAGWVLLFDGKSIARLRIEGEHEIVNGELRLGGTQPTRTLLYDLGSDFELHYEYATEPARAPGAQLFA
jgi:hypothetical protein